MTQWHVYTADIMQVMEHVEQLKKTRLRPVSGKIYQCNSDQISAEYSADMVYGRSQAHALGQSLTE